MFERHEFAEWRQMDITQELLKSITEAATSLAQSILTRKGRDFDGDEYNKGVLAGLDLVAGWQPLYIPDENRSVQDALRED